MGLVFAVVMQRHLVNGVGCFAAGLFGGWVMLVILFCLPIMIYAASRSIFTEGAASKDCASFPQGARTSTKTTCAYRASGRCWWAAASSSIAVIAITVLGGLEYTPGALQAAQQGGRPASQDKGARPDHALHRPRQLGERILPQPNQQLRAIQYQAEDVIKRVSLREQAHRAARADLRARGNSCKPQQRSAAAKRAAQLVISALCVHLCACVCACVCVCVGGERGVVVVGGRRGSGGSGKREGVETGGKGAPCWLVGMGCAKATRPGRRHGASFFWRAVYDGAARRCEFKQSTREHGAQSPPPPLPHTHTHTHTHHTHTHTRAVGGLEEWEGADYESTSDRVPRMGIFT